MKAIKGQQFYPKQAIYVQQPGTPSTVSIPKNYKNQERSSNLVNILQFEQDQYPFLNKYPTSPKIYKTQVIIKDDAAQIQERLNKIKHPNIIGVKEVKEREKVTGIGKRQSFLEITYQEVPFSIKFIGFTEQDSPFLFQKIIQSNLREILNKITIYLMKMEINRAIRLTDIGVTQQGTIKVYLPPILPKGNTPIPQHMVFSNNYKLVSWWETTFTKLTKQPQYSPTITPKNQQFICASKIKMSCNHLQREKRPSHIVSNRQLGDSYDLGIQRKNSLEEFKFITIKKTVSKPENLEECLPTQVKASPNLQTSTKSYQSQLSKMASFQVQKMKKIDKQIKLIKQRLEKRQKQKTDKRKDSDQFLQKNLQIIKKTLPAVKLIQSERKQNNNGSQNLTKPQQQVVFRDSIQQNINCINIYHNQTPPSPRQMFTKKAQPYQRPSYIPDPLDGISDQDSLDTYDIQFGNQEPIVNFAQKLALPSGKYDREISERNYKPKKDELKQSLSKKVNQKNQVQSRKFETESAGPLQFKNIVNNFIKPQFLAKKSNIYEEPMEEDSQNDFSHKLYFNQLAQAGRSVASKTHESQSTKKEEKDVKDMKMTKKDNNLQPTVEDIHRVKSYNTLAATVKNESKQQKEITNAKAQAEKQLVSRVQDILLKTKRAIAVLNRMKEGHGNLMRKALSP